MSGCDAWSAPDLCDNHVVRELNAMLRRLDRRVLGAPKHRHMPLAGVLLIAAVVGGGILLLFLARRLGVPWSVAPVSVLVPVGALLGVLVGRR